MERQEIERARKQVDMPPTIEELQEWNAQGYCEALDGCIVEPDGTCEHGYPSWMIELGLI